VKHTCHWPGCDVEVEPKFWGCWKHWSSLPKRLQNHIWATYRRGQEVTKTPSPEYIRAANDVQAWIAEQQRCHRSRSAKNHTPEGGT
jgi:hypothetical protein